MKYLLVLLIILLMIGCAEYDKVKDQTTDDTVWTRIAKYPDGYGVFRMIDYEASVVCWVSETRGGISCLPLDQTTLKK